MMNGEDCCSFSSTVRTTHTQAGSSHKHGRAYCKYSGPSGTLVYLVSSYGVVTIGLV